MAEILDERDEWLAEFKNGWLAHWQETGQFDWKLYSRPMNEPLPETPGIDLSKSRLLLISTAGAYLAGLQDAFDAANPLGDYSIRLLPSDVDYGDLAIAHGHYDTTAVEQDPQVLLPMDHLAEMVREDLIGELAPMVISYAGYQPDLTRVVDEMIPQILSVAEDLDADTALLVPA